MKNQKLIFWTLLCVCVLTGCQSFTGFDFDSDAIVGGGAVAGKDYITGLKPSLKAREYFVKSNANASQKKTVTPGDDQGTGVVWTDDGGIVIPPGCSIEFENKGYCLDPHLPAPKAGEEMQFVKTSSLIPDELQGTYRNLLKRSAAGDEDVKNNMQRLVWALRTAGSQDAMATHLTDRQREILSECAEDGSFEDFVYRQEMYGKIVEELKSKFVNRIKDSTSVRVGNVVYDAFDLLDHDKGKQKVEAHLQSLISMGLNLPITQTGFNYGELENGIFTDIKGNGPLSFKAKIANSTSQPYTFYPMNYAAQAGNGGSSVGFYAAANSGMRQRTTIDVPEEIVVDEGSCKHNWVQQSLDCDAKRKAFDLEINDMRDKLIEKLLAMDKEVGFEYGAIIFEENGEVKATKLVKGNRDYELVVRTMDGDYGKMRVAERDGKYYIYTKNNDGIYVINKSRSYSSVDCGTTILWKEVSNSFPAGEVIRENVPKGAEVLEIFHMHPDDTHWYWWDTKNHIFSEQDKQVADDLGVNISVVDTGGKYDLYKPCGKTSMKCLKCGATR